MKVSEFIQRYQLGGSIPETDDPMIAFWAVWLIGVLHRDSAVIRNFDQARKMAIKVAEFIEAQK